MKTSSHRALRVTLAASTSLVAALALTGCIGNPLDQIADQIGENAGQNAAEDIIEGVTGGDVSLGGELPDDFPAEVPLIDGPIQTAMGVDVEDGRGWLVSIKIDDSKAAAEKAHQAFLAAGFEEVSWGDIGGEMFTGSFKNDKYSVVVATLGEDDAAIINYTVTDITQ